VNLISLSELLVHISKNQSH